MLPVICLLLLIVSSQSRNEAVDSFLLDKIMQRSYQ